MIESDISIRLVRTKSLINYIVCSLCIQQYLFSIKQDFARSNIEIGILQNTLPVGVRRMTDMRLRFELNSNIFNTSYFCSPAGVFIVSAFGVRPCENNSKILILVVAAVTGLGLVTANSKPKSLAAPTSAVSSGEDA